MNDFEKRVKDLLNEQVDAEVGPRRAAPAFEAVAGPDRRGDTRPRRAPWVLPLLAAACVAAVVGATAGVSALLADNGDNAPATGGHSSTQVPPSSVVSTPRSSGPAQPSSVARTTAASRTSGSGTPHLVSLAGASISLPNGWVATAIQGDASANGPARHWCLHRGGAADVVCPLTLSTLSAPHAIGAGAYSTIDVDDEGYDAGNPPQYCAPAQPRVVEQAGDRTFGGRAADWRRWDRTCPSGHQFHAEQYVVATDPGFALFSESADAGVHAAMTEIVANSTLPAQAAPLRFTDRGIVRSVERSSSHVTVTIDRVVRLDSNGTYRIVNDNPATYTYVVPSTAIAALGALTVGTRVVVATDGTRVVSFGPDA